MQSRETEGTVKRIMTTAQEDLLRVLPHLELLNRIPRVPLRVVTHPHNQIQLQEQEREAGPPTTRFYFHGRADDRGREDDDRHPVQVPPHDLLPFRGLVSLNLVVTVLGPEVVHLELG